MTAKQNFESQQQENGEVHMENRTSGGTAMSNKPLISPPVHHRHEPNAYASVVVALGLMLVFAGVMFYTSYADGAGKGQPRSAARNMPMIHLR